MKKVLLILFVLAICVLAFPQGVLAATFPSNDVVISANYGTTTTFNAAKGVFPVPWNLAAGYDNEVKDGIVFTLTTQAPTWRVTAESDNGGFMHGNQGNLLSPFLVHSTFNSQYLAPTGGMVVKEGSSNYNNQNWNEYIRQPVALNDMGSGNGWTITIVFTCDAGF